ncbi:replication-relaxation family protein [Streptomyces sp. MNU89]|uniref:replication-relaxation family protein n=1 Tax=Streptomyces sp. MNU89 TaxID=2560025 RepID=UPI0027E0A256|nr:replication-relaxation family protein [Streptomyces sp. MNU89]
MIRHATPRPAHGPGSRYTARAATTRRRPARRTSPHPPAASPTATCGSPGCSTSTGSPASPPLLPAHPAPAPVDSFRPSQHGSAPEHYTLGPTGAALLAAHAGVDTTALGWRPSHTGRIAYSPSLGHDLGVNELLSHLAARARTTPGADLPLWLAESSCARRWSDIIRPDAYAHWQDDGLLLPFFLEYDTGSQTLPRVEAKLTGYAAFTTATGGRPALLIHTRTASRDQALRHRLARPAAELGLHVATSSADFTTSSPWGPWWTPLQPGGQRTTLTGLAAHWPGLTPAGGLEPSDADTPLTLPVPPLPSTPEIGP